MWQTPWAFPGLQPRPSPTFASPHFALRPWTARTPIPSPSPSPLPLHTCSLQAIAEATASLCLLTGSPVLDSLRHFLDSRTRALTHHLDSPATAPGVLPALTHALTLLQDSLTQACAVFLGQGEGEGGPGVEGVGGAGPSLPAPSPLSGGSSPPPGPDLYAVLDEVPMRVCRLVTAALGGALPPYLPAAGDRVRWGRLVAQALGFKDSWLYV
jgi:hypothetical protein